MDDLKDSWNIKGSVSEEIVKKIKEDNGRYWAGDNISKLSTGKMTPTAITQVADLLKCTSMN